MVNTMVKVTTERLPVQLGSSCLPSLFDSPLHITMICEGTQSHAAPPYKALRVQSSFTAIQLRYIYCL